MRSLLDVLGIQLIVQQFIVQQNSQLILGVLKIHKMHVVPSLHFSVLERIVVILQDFAQFLLGQWEKVFSDHAGNFLGDVVLQQERWVVLSGGAELKSLDVGGLGGVPPPFLGFLVFEFLDVEHDGVADGFTLVVHGDGLVNLRLQNS